MRRTGLTEILLIFLTIMVLLAVFTVLMALVYPNAAKSIISDISQSYESKQGGPIAVFGKLAKRGDEGFRARIVPAAQWIAKRFVDIFSRKKKGDEIVKKAKKEGARSFEAKDCVNCHRHENLFDRKAYANIYIDHRLHEAEGISCSRCHVDIKHPKPKRINKSTCVNCHEKTKVAAGCPNCHTPGSILSDAIIPEEKTAEFIKGGVASAKSLMAHNFGAPERQWLQGRGEAPCVKCHQGTSFCNQCHMVFHSEISNWRSVHGSRLLSHEYVITACLECHNANWCAGNCHINPGLKRSQAYLEPPNMSIESYIR